MTYQLDWYTEDHVIYLELQGQSSVTELRKINKEIQDLLDKQDNKIHIIFNAATMQTGHQTSNYLRDTQRYVDHLKVDTLSFVSRNKLNRLIAILAFSLSRAQLIQFENMETAMNHMKRLGFETNL